MVSPRWRASTPHPAAPARATSEPGEFSKHMSINSLAGGTEKGADCLALPPGGPYLRSPCHCHPSASATGPRGSTRARREAEPRSRSRSRSRSARAGGARSRSSPGGATGLGRHIAIEFGKLGCHVAFCFVNMPGRDVSEQALLTEAALTAMGVGVLAMRCDVRDRDAVDHFVARGQAAAGRRPLPGQQRRHRQRRRALAPERGRLERGARDQRDRRVQLHPRRRADLPRPALRQDRERQRAPGGAAGVRGGQLRGEQGGAARASPAPPRSSSAPPTST